MMLFIRKADTKQRLQFRTGEEDEFEATNAYSEINIETCSGRSLKELKTEALTSL